MLKNLPFRYLEPTFFAGLLDDPVLYLRVRPAGRALLLDCGQIHHLAKRVIKSVDAIFVSHAHMDHFMGIDTFTRNVHVAPRTIELYGPPGIAGKLEKKLDGYDWNLTEDYWCSYRVREVAEETLESYLLPGPEGFPCRFEGVQERSGREIYRNRWLRLSAAACDHKIPSLVFRIDEQPSFAVDDQCLADEELVRGDWLCELNRQFYRNLLGVEPLRVRRRMRDGRVRNEEIRDTDELYRRIRRDAPAASIGYVTDVGFNDQNVSTIGDLLAGVGLLLIECTFLQADIDKARASHHLCTADVSELVRRLSPQAVLPMHLSKSYIGRSSRLYEELEIPTEVQVIRLPEHIAPRPLLPIEAKAMIEEAQQKRAQDCGGHFSGEEAGKCQANH